MGKLIGLELCDFKSYKGTHEIGLGSSRFTSIIGPNGSGKSNLMDAICFVLGLSSSQLRSQSMKDLIYRGRRRRRSSSSSRRSLVDDVDVDDFAADPLTAYVAATYRKDDETILTFKRIIRQNGSTDYQINDRGVTKLNYMSVLQSEDILVKARNFLVFQGDVEQIASQAPRDLTKLLEHISGSDEYEAEYERLKEEMEKAHVISNSVFSRKKTLNSESKQYKEQASEQRQFEKHLILRNDTIKKINLYGLYHNEKKHRELRDSIDQKTAALTTAKVELAEKERALKSLTAEYSKSVLELKDHAKSIENLKSKLESTKRKLIPVNANKSSIASKIESRRRKIVDLDTNIKSQQEQIASFERQLKDTERLYDEFEARSRAALHAQASINVPKEGFAEYESLRSTYMASNGSILEEQLSLFINEKANLVSNLESIETQKSNVESRTKELHSEISLDLKPKLDDLEGEINQLLETKKHKVTAREDLIKQKDKFNKTELKLNTKLRDLLVKLEELSSQERESKKQQRLRENVAMLKRSIPGSFIKGIVHELVRPAQQKYELALSILLGRNSDAIIVENASTAYKCIEILKERRAGLATFIPLDSVEFDPINLNYLRSIDENAIPGFDIVHFDDPSLEPAISYVIGNTLVANDMNTARSLKWSHDGQFGNKIITLQGSIIHQSGQMTGGHQLQRHSASVSWDKQEMRRLSEQKETLVEELSKLQKTKPKELEIKMLAEEISQLDDKLPVFKNQKTGLERSIGDKQTEIEFQNSRHAQLQQSLASKEEQTRSLDLNINQIKEKMSTLKNNIFQDFCTKWGLENGIGEFEELHGNAARARQKERLQFTKALSVLSSKVQFETARREETEKRRNLIQNQVVELEAELVNIENQRQELEVDCDKVEAELDVLRSERKKANAVVQTKLKSSKSMEADVQEMGAELSNLAKQIIQLEESLLKVDTQRGSILRNCKIQNIILPLLDGDLGAIPVVSDNSNGAADRLYEIEVDYEMLDAKYKELHCARFEIELEATLQGINEILERLTPNAKAMERFRDVENRLRSYDQDYSVARQNERKAADKFQKIKEKRFDKFMDAFNHISGCIDATYKDLTRSRALEVGGSAYLMLENDDLPFLSGVKFHAVPPMKRFEDMELLSGGEKTIAALALLFAIHSYKPAPFFVLDEVDAALDNSNVSKIGNYIRNHASRDLQFIVISLKSSLYEKSDGLVGIYREQAENSSKTVTLDLTQYEEEGGNVVAGESESAAPVSQAV
ncbi:uncharacterized protein LODBEIA_P08000 [Lodderomyces beijingensis]|uniref:Structural maintenance of chromosomes protein n=1 Tax=Lodderomyces beijingensis TaxID=1775926 RepID=A0ABP0ZHJ8_9ASCO